jgi:molecular chaperone GrpE
MVDGESETETSIDIFQKDGKYKQAEIQTLSRRIEEERRKAADFAISKFALSLLSTSDVLSTALSHVPKPVEPGTPLASLVNGVEMTQKALWKTFEQNRVVKMDVARGGTFDPNTHEATFQIPKEIAGEKGNGEAWGAGEVVEVSKEGWTIAGRVLRPAQVGVTQVE